MHSTPTVNSAYCTVLPVPGGGNTYDGGIGKYVKLFADNVKSYPKHRIGILIVLEGITKQ